MNGQYIPGSTLPSAVLDTNTVLDMLLFDDHGATALAQAVQARQVRWIGTARMREELTGVLRRPRMGRWAPPERAAAILAVVHQCLEVVPAPAATDAPTCRDAADQMFIDLAWDHRTQWLLTRDKALLRLTRAARSRAVQVCTPAAWSVAWFARTAGAPLTA